MPLFTHDGMTYSTGPYGYSTPDTYTAYCASWAPQYFTGMPLGDYTGATVLPKLTKTPVMLRSANPCGRTAISLDKVHEEPTMDPKKALTVPNIMLMDIEAPPSEPVTNHGEIATLSKPSAKGKKRKRLLSAQSDVSEAEMPAVHPQSSSAHESEDEVPTQRHRLSTMRNADSDGESDDVPTERNGRHAPVAHSRQGQANDRLEMDAVLARRQYEENYGSRGGAKLSRRAKRFRET